MSKRTRFLLGIGVIAALVIGWQVAAFAVHDIGVFELDGNATDNTAVAGDDWNTATAKTFVPEPNLNASIFTGGGSKDPQDISKWAWKDGAGGLPDKDNLLDGFAVRYTDATAGELLYFGSDRYDNSGDAQQGFWFLQDEVDDNGTNSVGGGTGFTGVHTEGDILVVTDFSNGGTTSTITVYEWNTACTKAGQKVDLNDPPTPTTNDDNTCGDANLLILASSADALCDADLDPGANTSDDFCGIVNSPTSQPPNGTITLPWTFNDKTPNDGTNTALQGEFFEGGLNLSALGLDDECFSTFAVESRSSTSTTATLKDFILGDFESCTGAMTTDASRAGTITPGTSVTDTATVTGSGSANAPAPGGTVTFFLCGPTQVTDADGCPIDVGTPVPAAGTPVTLVAGANSTSTATSSAVSPTAPGKYCFRAHYSGDSNYPADDHSNASTEDPNNECFIVQDTSDVSTTQSWIPNDAAHVTLASGGIPTGTVTFTAYQGATCEGTAIAGLTNLANRTIDGSGNASTANTTPVATTQGTTTISWKATTTLTGVTGTTSHCETSTVTIDNDITTP